MATSLHRIALVGAGGNLGKFVLQELRQHPAFQISIVTREGSKHSFDGSEKVFKVTDDYSEDSLCKAFDGQDAVVVMTNAMSGGVQTRMIDAAIKSRVKRYIPPDYGSSGNIKAAEVFPMFHNNFKVVDYLKEKESTGLTWTNVISGLFIDLAIPNGFMNFKIADKEAAIWDSGETKFSCSTRPFVAKTIAAILNKPEQTKNRVVYASGFTTNQNEMLRSFEKVTGAPWKTTSVSSEERIKIGQEGMQKGDFMAIINLPLAVSYGGKCEADLSGKLDNVELGLQEENLDEVLQKLVAQ